MKISGPNALPAGHAALMGGITNAWAQLEFEIDRGIWTLLGSQHQLAACVTSQLNYVHPRIKAFIALVHLHGGDNQTIRELNTFYQDRISGLSELRNRSVHDPRMLDYDTQSVHRFEATAKPKITFGWTLETTLDLKTLHDRIYQVVTDFNILRDKVIAAIQALPQSSRPQLISIVEVKPVPLR